MPSRQVTFQFLIEQGILEIGDGYRAKLDELGGSGPIFLRAGSLTDQGFIWEGNDRFHQGLSTKVQTKMGLAGDVVITTKGNSTGRTGYVGSDAPPFVYSPHLSYWRVLRPTYLSSGYLRYWSRCSEFIEQLHSMAHGTDMAPYLSLADQKRLKITLPSIGVQNAIAEVLGVLDDKIAVNDRIAATALELTAATLERMLTEDEDASRTRLDEIAYINQHKVRPTAGGHLRYLDISSVSIDHYEWPARISWEEAPSRARRMARRGDTIWSTVRPNRKSRAMILDDDPELVVSTGFAVLSPKGVGSAYLYEVSRRDEFAKYLENVAEGSAYPAVRAERFASAEVPLLSASYLNKFESQAMNLHSRVHAARRESRVLEELRDTLLPELMSGEIRVRNAEKAVEGAV